MKEILLYCLIGAILTYSTSQAYKYYLINKNNEKNNNYNIPNSVRFTVREIRSGAEMRENKSSQQ